MPPPYFVARYGNLQIFPSPTDAPAADRTYPSLPEKLLLCYVPFFSFLSFFCEIRFYYTILSSKRIPKFSEYFYAFM